MATRISYQLPAAGVRAILCGDGHPRMEYADGERTDRHVMIDGRTVVRYPAVFSTDGVTVLGTGSLDTTSELAGAFGTVFHGLAGQMATVQVTPMSQYEVRLTVTMETAVPVEDD